MLAMKQNALEIKEPEDPLKRLAKNRGIFEVVIAVLGLLGMVMSFANYSRFFTGAFSLLMIIVAACLLILELFCGIMSFRRPYEFIWLNLIVGGYYIVSAITILIRLLVSGRLVYGLFGFVFGLAIASVILYPTIKIRRSLLSQAETQSDGGV
jgi:hypothetical protein